MATTNPNLPPLEVQTSFLFREMNQPDGGGIGRTFTNNPGMTAAEAAIAFENQFERSGGSNVSGRVNFANNVYNSFENGSLSSLPSNAQYVFNQALANGYTPQQAAGIVGNLQAESGPNIDPFIVNEIGASGIAQWLGVRRTNLQAFDPGTGEVVPNTEVQAGDIGPSGEPLTAEEAQDIRESAQAREGEERLRTAGVGLYQENILNQYESYTYRWAVHMCHPMEAHEFEALIDKNRVVTLAESGIDNEISIESVSQNLVLTFAQENRNSVANQFTFNFLEPGGATFFTRIYQAALQLGIENHLHACYLLELNFTGWKPDGTAEPEIIGPYYYMTTLSSLTMDHKDGASGYVGDFIETMTDAYSRLEFHLTADIDIEASTFGEFLTEFQDRVNEQSIEQAKNGLGQILPHEYVFGTTIDGEEWQSWEFDALTGDRLVQYSGISVSGSGTLRFSMAAGTAITSAISLALFQTERFKRLYVGDGFAKDNADDGEARPERLADIVRWVKYNTSVEYLEYDFLLRHYQRRLTYLAGPYIAPETIHDPSSYLGLVTNPQLQTDRLRNIFNEGLLRKRFDYIHTGLNTEILDLDIQLNNVYYQIQALNSGVINHRENTFNGSAGQTQFEVASLRADRDSLRARRGEITSQIDSLNEEIDNAFANVNSAEEAIQADQTRARLQAQVDDLAMERRELAREISVAEVNYDRVYNEFLEASRSSGTRLDLPELQKRYLTQGDLYTSQDLTELLPLNFRYGPVDSLATRGPDKGIDDVGSVMLGAVEMNLNSLADLVEQTLHIRGDPYWLGRPRGNFAQETQANYDLGGLQYFLNLSFPTYPDENTGLMTAQTNFIVTGVYRVYQVQANYTDGQFTMMLQSFRDMNTNVETLYEELLFGNVFDRAATDIRNRTGGENETENTGAEGETAPGAESDSGSPPGTNGGDSNPNVNLDPNINPALASILSDTAAQTGVTIEGTSGVRYAPNTPGTSGRHAGDAHDIALFSNGRRLSVSNPSDRAIINQFTRNYVANARAAGYTPSVGWANHTYPSSQWYMGGNTGHYDIAVGNSIGSNRGTYWGGSGETASVPAPSWLVDVMTG